MNDVGIKVKLFGLGGAGMPIVDLFAQETGVSFE